MTQTQPQPSPRFTTSQEIIQQCLDSSESRSRAFGRLLASQVPEAYFAWVEAEIARPQTPSVNFADRVWAMCELFASFAMSELSQISPEGQLLCIEAMGVQFMTTCQALHNTRQHMPDTNQGASQCNS